MISEKREETYKMKNCGISRWDDPAEINRKLKYLTSQPIWEVDDEYYDNVVMKYFDEKCKGSREIYEESQKYIPGGVQHNLAFNKPFPMSAVRIHAFLPFVVTVFRLFDKMEGVLRITNQMF